MKNIILYFQMHQPFRMHPDGKELLWEDLNRELFLKISNNCYLPTFDLFSDLIKNQPKLKITIGMSGTFLKQAQQYNQKIIDKLHHLYNLGVQHSQVEFLQETYSHSLSSMTSDPKKNEFKNQVTLHRNIIKELFGVRPKIFRNTELIYNNEIGNIVADMGYLGVICDFPRNPHIIERGVAPSNLNIFNLKGRKRIARDLLIFPRQTNLSNKIEYNFKTNPILGSEYLDKLNSLPQENITLGYNLEHIGEHFLADEGIFDFWRDFLIKLSSSDDFKCITPTETVLKYNKQKLNVIDINQEQTTSWSYDGGDTTSWLGSQTQKTLFNELISLETIAHKSKSSYLDKWRNLTTSDHFLYLKENSPTKNISRQYFNPYNSQIHATYLYTKHLEKLKDEIRSFNIIRKKDEIPIVVISPETARLPSRGMGDVAKFISGKSGGLGEVTAALCNGLVDRNIKTHLITLDLSTRFKEESNLSENEWLDMIHGIDSENIHLISSAYFENKRSAYEGSASVTAAEFQKQIVNSTLKSIINKSKGKAIIHSHDWFAGGIISAFCQYRKLPLLHTIHNTHTGYIPTSYYSGVNLQKLGAHLYFSRDDEKGLQIDCQASAIKNASMISVVGKKFLEEIVMNYFSDRSFISSSVRNEISEKFRHNAAQVIANGISPSMYPENQTISSNFDSPGLATILNRDNSIIPAKKANLLKLQHILGLEKNENAIMLYWPSRLDSVQKGVELFEHIAIDFAKEHKDIQFVIIGDPVVKSSHGENIKKIASILPNQIAYHPFNEQLSMLAYAASSDVFGASLYEPFGQIDVVGNIFGATATNRNTGGYHDKIIDLSLQAWGGPQDVGNGVLFKDYDPKGLWWGLNKTVLNHRYFRQNPDQWSKQTIRIMTEARNKWSLDNMIAGYITAYQKLQKFYY